MCVLLAARVTPERQMFTIRSHLDQLCCSPALLPLVVSQGGHGHVLHQPLELFIPGHKIRLTVDLNTPEKTTGGAVDRPLEGDTESLALTSTIAASWSCFNTPMRPWSALRPSSLLALVQPSLRACS